MVAFCCTVASALASALYLLVGSGLLHTPAVGVRSRVAGRAWQAVVAGLSVLTAVHSVKDKAGVRDKFTLQGGTRDGGSE